MSVPKRFKKKSQIFNKIKVYKNFLKLNTNFILDKYNIFNIYKHKKVISTHSIFFNKVK